MTDFVFPPAPIVSLPVAGSSARFPVRRIYCVGRNYAAHIREMGGDEREPPFFFQKPTDAIVLSGATIALPSCTEDFQHEIELVLAIGRPGQDIAVDAAARHVWGLAAGIDLTRRDLQVAARKTGRPWESGKSFDRSAAITEVMPLAGELPARGGVSLTVNGERRQSGDLGELIWSCAEIVSELSKLYRLEPGDLVYTGTPAGVGRLVAGDRVLGQVDGLPPLTLTIAT
jgi:fumarylpyruvate hydrolase